MNLTAMEVITFIVTIGTKYKELYWQVKRKTQRYFRGDSQGEDPVSIFSEVTCSTGCMDGNWKLYSGYKIHSV